MSILIEPNLTEEAFEELLPEKLQSKSKCFFTPAEVAIEAAKWLSGKDKRKVLDIGAGVGKFCLFGARHTGAQFLGIEYRKELVEIANSMFNLFGVKNARVIHKNIIDFDFSDFKAFYYYNPYGENLARHLRLDDSQTLSERNYYLFMEYTLKELSKAPRGTRLVTYYGSEMMLPQNYVCIKMFMHHNLKFWIKES